MAKQIVQSEPREKQKSKGNPGWEDGGNMTYKLQFTLNVNFDSIILYQTIVVVMSYVEVFRI